MSSMILRLAREDEDPGFVLEAQRCEKQVTSSSASALVCIQPRGHHGRCRYAGPRSLVRTDEPKEEGQIGHHEGRGGGVLY